MTFLRFIFIWLVMAIAMAIPANAVDIYHSDYTILKPSSPWQVNYEVNDCQLYRDFGEGENKLTLRIVFIPSNSKQDFMIIGASIPEKIQYENLQISLNLNPIFEKIYVLTYNLKDRPDRVLRWFGSEAIWLKKSGTSQTIRINDARDYYVQLNLGNPDAALSTIQTCQDSLLERWGLDPKVFRAVSRQPIPKGNPGAWVTAAEYPTSAFKKKITGDVTFALTIDQKGKPTGCKVAVSSGNKDLDDKTCILVLKRAQFSPALNSANEAVPSFFINRVRWVLPQP
jgi:TonB family protein